MKILFLFCFISCFLQAQQEIQITLKNGDETEIQAKAQLERIINQHNIKEWIFTKEIVIDKNSHIPFSHPVLTLNTRYLEDDVKQLATFIHEQFHWYAESHPTKLKEAIQDFKKIFPQTPDRNNGGARDEYSNYLHLIICDLEFQALTRLSGEPKARLILEEWKHYKWVYTKVLNDPVVRQTNIKHGLIAP